jgi:hypothetical protein
MMRPSMPLLTKAVVHICLYVAVLVLQARGCGGHTGLEHHQVRGSCGGDPRHLYR